MAGKLKQSDRVAEFKTPLGTDKLVLINFEGTEGLGELFDYRIEALSEDENLDFDTALGQGCTLKLTAYDGKQRIYNGVLVQAQWIGKTEDFHQYSLVLRPWFWLLGHKADCRIFLKKDVKEIIQEVFDKAGFSDYKFRTNEDYDKIPYCVQYRETDLAFVSRLMEMYGIYYFFEHEDGKHMLIMADSRSSHKASPDLAKVPFLPLSKSELRQEQHLNEWVSERKFRTGKVEFNAYDYLQPPKKLKAPSEASEKYKPKLEVYDFQDKYDEEDKGKKLSRIRLQAEQALDHRRLIRGDAPSLHPGVLVTVDKHPVKAENKEYLVIRSTHHFTSHHYRSAPTVSEQAAATAPGAEVKLDQVYYGHYEFQPADRPFRMLPLTPRPRIHGIQTAKVVGKKGEEREEISTDEHGRIWVKFFWDRAPELTCPIRVAQVWASKKWGGIFLPRIGMEVVVEFLDGDPDHPLVIGTVYNGDNKTPYDLPDNKTMAGWKSNSSKGGNGYNELVFEDKKNSENIRMHAEKDHEVIVRHAETNTIGEVFMPPKGSPSRETTLKHGDDKLTIQTGDQSVSIPLGSQTTTATIKIGDTVLMTSVTLTPVSQAVEAPLIKHDAAIAINQTAGLAITLTAPIINLNGMVRINGMTPVVVPV